MTDFSPREIVSELDRFIVGQKDAKHAVAIALRNRWRRLRLEGSMREEVLPKNILMIGPTGVRQDRDFPPPRQARGRAFSESRGDEIHRGRLCRPRCRADRPRSCRNRDHDDEGREAQGGFRARPARGGRAGLGRTRRHHRVGGTRDSFRKRLRAGELDDKEIEIEISQAAPAMPMFELPNMPGSAIGAISIGDIFGKALGNRAKPRRTTVKDAQPP